MTADEYLQQLIPTLTQAQRDLYLDFAGSLTGADMYGGALAKALALRAAHYYTLSQRGAGGAVTSMKEGDLAISFGSQAEDLSTTVYGQMLQDMKKAFGFTMGVTG